MWVITVIVVCISSFCGDKCHIMERNHTFRHQIENLTSFGIWAFILLSTSFTSFRSDHAVIMQNTGAGVNGKIISLPKGWSVAINNNSLPEFQAAQNITPGSYRLLTMSENETFGLGFFNINGTGQYVFSIIIATNFRNSSAGALVWSANRNAPVSENSSLVLTDQGHISLVKTTGSSVWQSPGGVAALELQESGNLILLNKMGDIIWHSFDFPTDTLFKGQTVHGGTRLVSSSRNSPSEGNYTLVIEPSGVVLYLNVSNASPQPYFLWSLLGSDLTSALQICNGYEAFVNLSGSGVNMYYQLNSGQQNINYSSLPPCAPDLTVSFPITSTSLLSEPICLRLESDGNLVSHRFSVEQLAWTNDFMLSSFLSDSCKLPMTCGSYGICLQNISVPSKCDCPIWSNKSTVSDLIDGFQIASICADEPPWKPQACTVNEGLNHHFLEKSGVSYFTTKYTKPDKQPALLLDCLNTCSSNCSCSAVFYDNVSRSCYFVDNVLGSLTAVDFGSTGANNAYLKFQNKELITALPKSPASFGRNRIIGVATGSVAFLAVLGTICYVVVKKRAREKWSRENMQNDSAFPALRVLPRRFSLKELYKATKGFSCKLGGGGFGSVYAGRLPTGKEIAVKKLESLSQGQKEFIAEVSAMGVISHVHIVKLLGFCADGVNRMLVYEYMANGSLDRWLFREAGSATNMDVFLDWKTRHKIALATARGIAYLHEECREPILHLDIKPENILLDEQFEAKVSDFGMSKLLLDRDKSSVITRVRGTPGYLAPEWLLNSTATKKCDVYSFGMLLLELVSGRRNLEPKKLSLEYSGLSWYFPAWAVSKIQASDSLMDLVEENMRSLIGEEQVKREVQIALWCIQENPTVRPNIDVVVQMLEGHTDVSDPPLNFRFAVETQGMVDITTSGSNMQMIYVAAEPSNSTTIAYAP